YGRKHHGPDAAFITLSCCAGVSATARCFFTRGGSELVTGFVVTNPHLMARENADDTTPAMFRTVFVLSGRGVFLFRVCPPHFSSLLHSRLRCNGLISAIGIWSNAASRYAACSR